VLEAELVLYNKGGRRLKHIVELSLEVNCYLEVALKNIIKNRGV